MNKNNIDYEMTALQLLSVLNVIKYADEDTPITDIKYTAALATTVADTLYSAIVNEKLKKVIKE